MAANANLKSPAASETLDVLMEMSRLLNTGLDKETLAVCLQLCENGVNPEALAEVIKELRRESASIKASESSEGAVNTSSGRG